MPSRTDASLSIWKSLALLDESNAHCKAELRPYAPNKIWMLQCRELNRGPCNDRHEYRGWSNKTDKELHYYVEKRRWVRGYFCPCVSHKLAMNIHCLTKYFYTLALCGTRGRPPQTSDLRQHTECSLPNLLCRVSTRCEQTFPCINRLVHCVYILQH
jgi:hypothetical protein